MLGQVGYKQRLEHAFIADDRLVIDIAGDQRTALFKIYGALLIIEGLEAFILGITGQNLEFTGIRIPGMKASRPSIISRAP